MARNQSDHIDMTERVRALLREIFGEQLDDKAIGEITHRAICSETRSVSETTEEGSAELPLPTTHPGRENA